MSKREGRESFSRSRQPFNAASISVMEQASEIEGKIAEAAVYDRALTPEEVASNAFADQRGVPLDAATRTRFGAALDARARDEPPFAEGPDELARTPGAVWASPELVIRAEIGGWSRDGIVRQASFVQEAPEVNPASVERQDAVGPEAAARALAKAGITRGAGSPAVIARFSTIR